MNAGFSEADDGGTRLSMRPSEQLTRSGVLANQAGGFGYRIPGLLSWAIVALCVIGASQYQGVTLIAFAAFCAFFFVRTLTVAVYSVRGNRLMRAWSAGELPFGPDVVGHDGMRPEDVHHIVLVPNYSESPELLTATLEALTAQTQARKRVTVVLAMEAKEPGAAEKAAALVERFESRFAHMLVTMHPYGLPGEIPCKGSNQAWAAVEARRFVVDELGIPSANVTVTSCDADSILHPLYLTVVERHFVADSQRYERFWQAPLLYYNNIWRVPVPVRFVSYVIQALMLSDLVNPLAQPLPISTYTLSLDLLDDTGYWDPDVISEDWHIYLQAFFVRKGHVGLTRIYLPVLADAPDGETTTKALLALYHQMVRHSWGAEDFGYMVEQWNDARDIPAWTRYRLLGHVLRDHLLRSVPWFIFLTGWALWNSFAGLGILGLVSNPLVPDILRFTWAGGAVALLALFAIELRRNPPRRRILVPVRALELLACWAVMPVTSLLFCTLPAMYAQSRLMLGQDLLWRVTEKRRTAAEGVKETVLARFRRWLALYPHRAHDVAAGDGVHNVEALCDLPEHRVVPVEEALRAGADVELGTSGIR